jgi:hypothetical protein
MIVFGSGNHGNWKFVISMVLRRAGLWSIIQEWIDTENTDGSSEAFVAGVTTTRHRSKAADDKAKESEEILTINDLTLDSSQYQHIHRDSLWWSAPDDFPRVPQEIRVFGVTDKITAAPAVVIPAQVSSKHICSFHLEEIHHKWSATKQKLQKSPSFELN